MVQLTHSDVQKIQLLAGQLGEKGEFGLVVFHIAELADVFKAGLGDLPLVGRLDARTLIAAGHGRSGFLLAPWTAEQIVSELIPVGAHS